MANVFITGDFNTPVQLNEEKESKMISIKKKIRGNSFCHRR